MADWFTVRVLLLGREGDPAGSEPGRIMLVRSDHTFADLSEAVDTAFGRWDLTPPHAFHLRGRTLWSEISLADGEGPAQGSADVEVGEVGLRAGSTFRYVFDLGEEWEHVCEVERDDVDPLAEYGDEPDLPVPVYGWGSIPDQYGREQEDDDEEPVEQEVEPEPYPASLFSDEDDAAFAAAEDDGRRDALAVVESALATLARPVDRSELARVARSLRQHAGEDRYPYDLLWAAAAGEQLPADDAGLWITLAAAVVEPLGELPLDPDVEAAWTALEPADWAAAVLELVRAGAGQRAEPQDLVRLVAASPEIEGPPLTAEDVETLELAFMPVVALWRVLRAVDDRSRLTALGCWGLPEALRVAWAPALSHGQV